MEITNYRAKIGFYPMEFIIQTAVMKEKDMSITAFLTEIFMTL